MQKIVALVLAIVLCLSFATALAGGSKTTQDLTSTSSRPSSGGSSGSYVEETSITVTQPTAETEQIRSELANGDANIAEYLGLTTEDIAETTKVNELIPVSISGIATRPVEIRLNTAASYAADDKPVVMVGYMVNGQMVWKKLACQILDGKLVVTFPADVWNSLANRTANLVVLSSK